MSHHLVNGLAQAGGGYSEFIRDTQNITEVVSAGKLVMDGDG